MEVTCNECTFSVKQTVKLIIVWYIQYRAEHRLEKEKRNTARKKMNKMDLECQDNAAD